MKQLLELPLNLTIVSPAHTPNWDLVSDVVNSCSRIYRSPKQCRNRYENVIIPREEGKVRDPYQYYDFMGLVMNILNFLCHVSFSFLQLIYEANPKKNKTKSIYKVTSFQNVMTFTAIIVVTSYVTLAFLHSPRTADLYARARSTHRMTVPPRFSFITAASS